MADYEKAKHVFCSRVFIINFHHTSKCQIQAASSYILDDIVAAQKMKKNICHYIFF